MIPGLISRSGYGLYGGKRSAFQRRAQAVAFSVLMAVMAGVVLSFGYVLASLG